MRAELAWKHASISTNVLTPLRSAWGLPLLLFGLSILILLRTVAPTLYYLDSPEFAIGASTLGIVHAPGYPLYLVIAHLFTRLPLGDVAFRVNLFSVLCLALAVPILYQILLRTARNRTIAASVTLAWAFAYPIWATGVVAEVYAPQLLTVAICAWCLTHLWDAVDRRDPWALLTGIAVGIAVAMHPSSALLAPGVVVAFLLLKVPLRTSVAAGSISILLFLLTLAYFPIRFAAHPALNLAGHYDSEGLFQPVNLNTLEGIVWMLRGGQFTRFFFSGTESTVSQLWETLLIFWNGYLGFGVLIGTLGVAVAARRAKGLLVVWLASFVPFVVFYASYGVPDRDLMLGPAFLLGAIMIALGLQWCLLPAPAMLRSILLLVLPIIIFAVNFPRLDLSGDSSVRTQAQETLRVLPENAIVFGDWLNVVPLQYLQLVEGNRSDLTLLNRFLFNSFALSRYVDTLLTRADRPLIFLSNTSDENLRIRLLSPSRYSAQPLQILGGEGTGSVVAYLLTPR